MDGSKDDAGALGEVDAVPRHDRWVCNVHQYPLPDGPEERTPVKVVDRPRDNGSLCVVETADGRWWTAFHWQVDVGCRWEVAGGGWREKHPDLLDYLEWRCGHVAAGRQREALAWVLERNGRQRPN